MNTSEIVDIEKLSDRLAKTGESVFFYWTETAREICPDKYKDFIRIRKIYEEIPASELSPLKFESFVGAVLDIMPTLEQKKSLLRTEAIAEILFDKRS